MLLLPLCLAPKALQAAGSGTVTQQPLGAAAEQRSGALEGTPGRRKPQLMRTRPGAPSAPLSSNLPA